MRFNNATQVADRSRSSVVRLSGFVGSQADINKAVELARSVEGVKSVKNDMLVK